jgi:DNA-binding transcriptional ArsR family regulator
MIGVSAHSVVLAAPATACSRPRGALSTYDIGSGFQVGLMRAGQTEPAWATPIARPSPPRARSSAGARERYERAGDLFKVLSVPARLAIVDLLSSEDCFVHEVMEATGLSQPNASHHLRILRDAGLVRRARSGRKFAYALSSVHVARMVRDALAEQ